MVASVVFNKLRGLQPATINLLLSRYYSWILAAENEVFKGNSL